MSFYNDERVNPSIKYNNYKMYMHLIAEYQIYKSKLTTEKKNTKGEIFQANSKRSYIV